MRQVVVMDGQLLLWLPLTPFRRVRLLTDSLSALRMRTLDQIVPEIVFVAETLDLVQFDVGILRPGRDGASHPPVRPGQTGGQVGPSSGRSWLLRAAALSNDFAVRGLPQPGQAGFFAEHDGVIPPPDHHLGAVRRGRDGHQVAG